ncbi:hypothetical protein MMC25_006781 [Agyrium rufum]|nr:hypothetical protein [Agyrium rufum]
MRILSLPGLEFGFGDDKVPAFPYTKTFEDARQDPFLVPYTSGSTSVPKLLTFTHGTFTANDTLQLIPSKGLPRVQTDIWKEKRVFVTFPWFFGAGVANHLPITTYNDFIPAIPPMIEPVTAEILNTRNPEYLENLTRVQHVTFAGGPLLDDVKNVTASKTHLNGA